MNWVSPHSSSMKNLNHAIAFSLLAFLIPTFRATALPRYPDYPCYMQNTRGQIINLTEKICRTNRTIPVSSELVADSTASSRSPKLEIAGIEITSDGAKGQIKNLSDQPVTVRIIKARQRKNTVWIFANTTVAPKGKAAFSEVAVVGNATVAAQNRADLGRVDEIIEWIDMARNTHTENFAGCQFISNVEKEKVCKYR
jgi:hypothetical protein